MPDPKPARPTSLGIYDKAAHPPITGIEVVALILAGLWLVGSVVFFLVLAPSGVMGGTGGVLNFMLILLVVFMPVAMIWVGATAARSAKVMREESRRLQAAIDAIRQAYVIQSQSGARAANEPSVARKLDEIAAAQRKTETALATFSSSRQPGAARPAQTRQAASSGEGDQVALPLGTPAEEIRPPLSTEDFIRALNFPETAEDKPGFAALRRALKDRPTALLIQAAQDILTLLSQDGIYMDDLRPEMARPEVWRRFGAGARGREIAALGGIRDRSSLALAAARMKSDPIFRDAAHHFLRRFDRIYASFAETASDADITEFSDTRTARAFMLLGRIAGTFD